MSNPCGLWVHPRLGVGTVWRGISASGGWRCLPLLARRSAGARPGLTVASVSWACEGRHKAGTYRELTGLKERSVANPSRAGTRPECGHQVGEACCRRGGVAGAEPPHKGGPNRPDRPEQQWSVVSGQWSDTAFALPETGTGTDCGMVEAQRHAKVCPHIGMRTGLNSCWPLTPAVGQRAAAELSFLHCERLES